MANLSPRILTWYDQHGRKNLPWQQDRDPYKIWVSEVMLQQTQVTTVIPYFERFLERFPTVEHLAQAALDDVLHLWTGLGYYARARNLLKAAQIICAEHNGQFPDCPDLAYQLPGVGKSTAHAVLALAFGHRLAILDGNVKRVLARHYRVHGWPGKSHVSAQLWTLATENTPAQRTQDYTQAIMDLGAIVCTRNPSCEACPLATTCLARAHQEQDRLPTSAPRKRRPVRSTNMIIVRNGDEVLLQQRPPTGIWGGLWGFPECETPQDASQQLLNHLGLGIQIQETWAPLRHSFTHFHLEITPVIAALSEHQHEVMENPGMVWYNLFEPDARGLAAPVKKLLDKLR